MYEDILITHFGFNSQVWGLSEWSLNVLHVPVWVLQLPIRQSTNMHDGELVTFELPIGVNVSTWGCVSPYVSSVIDWWTAQGVPSLHPMAADNGWMDKQNTSEEELEFLTCLSTTSSTVWKMSHSLILQWPGCLIRLSLLYGQQLVLMISDVCVGQMLRQHDGLHFPAHAARLSAQEENTGVRQRKRRRYGMMGGGGRGASAVVISSKWGVAFLSSDTYSNSSPSLRCGVLITANMRLAAGGCGTAMGSRGSNDGGQWPRAPGGMFVGGDSLLLM